MNCLSAHRSPPTATLTHQAWERYKTQDKEEVLDCDPISRIQLRINGLRPSQTWLSREGSLLSLHSPAASGEEVTMGTDTKGLMLEGKAGEGAERGFK